MSNTRKPRNRRRSSSTGDRLAQASSDELRGHLTLMQLTDRAEARGDAAGALRLMQGLSVDLDGEPFWRPSRLRRLEQLTAFRDVLPRWATSRWILAQALQVLDSSSRDRVLRSLATAIELRGGQEVLTGVDRIDARAKVMDHDWVHRQLHLYDLGGLRHFLDTVAAPELVAAADRIGEWACVPMGAYRLLSCTPLALVWENLASGRSVEVANIGSATFVDDGEWVIGRLVPIEAGFMFESAPLPVPEDVAVGVAAEPERWVEILREWAATQDAAFVRSLLGGQHDFGLLSDVPDLVWRSEWREMSTPVTRTCGAPLAAEYGEETGEDWDEADDLWDDPGCDEDADELVVEASSLVTFAGAVLHAGLRVGTTDGWLCSLAAAALVVPGVLEELAWRAGVAPEIAEDIDWDRVADRLPEPAATIARGFATQLRAPA